MAEPDFNQVCQQFRQFRGVIDQALAAPGDAAIKQQLQSLTATLDKTFQELQEVYPKAQAEIDAMLAGVHKSAKETGEKIASLKESIAAAEAQAAAAAKGLPEGTPPDPQLGQRLREELLERFGHHLPSESPPSTDREIWEDWDWQEWSNN